MKATKKCIFLWCWSFLIFSISYFYTLKILGGEGFKESKLFEGARASVRVREWEFEAKRVETPIDSNENLGQAIECRAILYETR